MILAAWAWTRFENAEWIGTRFYRLGLCILVLSSLGLLLVGYFHFLTYVHPATTAAGKKLDVDLGSGARALTQLKDMGLALVCVIAGRWMRGRKRAA